MEQGLSTVAGFGGFVVRGQRSTIWIAAAAALLALLLAALAPWQETGVAGRSDWLAALRLAVYCAGAVGVIVLGVGCGRLAGVVTSIAARFASTPAPADRAGGPQGLRALTDAVETHLANEDRMARQLREELQDLQVRSQLCERQKRHVEAILYSLRDAVLVVDGSDRLLMANEPAAKLFGFEAGGATHEPLAEVIGRTHAEFVELLRQSRCSRTEATKRELVFTQGNRPRAFEAIVSCVQEDGKTSGVVAVLHDVTREKEVAQMKNDFVSHVSHELKTPLASITAYSEMLADGEAADEETRKEFYAVIQNQAQRLNRLIEDILNISRIESGLIKVKKEQASLTILIEEQMQMICSYAEEKNITVTSGRPIVYDQVYVDKDMISQVIINLLSNAVKYTPAGGHVTVGTEVDEAARLARVTVTDTGVGIPEEDMGHLFEKFFRVSANNKQAKGTGLGLNLAKQIVEKVHDGRMFVTSKVGVGSTFGFELPLATAGQAVAV
jgi:two-component system, OmpR family, phosphate regulon sensor histidine kinase PhoR